MSEADQNQRALANASERGGRAGRLGQFAQSVLPGVLERRQNPIAKEGNSAMRSKIIALDYAPNNEAADAVLADIIADIKVLRLPSANKLNLYAQERLSAHEEAMANSEISLASDEDEFEVAFKELRALVDDPVPLETDAEEDVFDHLDGGSKSPKK